MVSDGTEFTVGDIERLFAEARLNTKDKPEKWGKYNRHRREVQIKVNDWVLIATHPLSSATKKVVAKFKPKIEGPYRVLEVKNKNVVIWKALKRLTINVDQVRIYRHRKSGETEIGTGSSDNGSLCDESSGFDRVQRISNESQYGKKKGSDVKRDLEENGLSFFKKMIRVRDTQMRQISTDHLSDQYLFLSLRKVELKEAKMQFCGFKRSRESGSNGPERKIRKGSISIRNKRTLSSNDSIAFPICNKKRRTQDKVADSVNRYNLKPRGGREVESRTAMEMKTQQGGLVRTRKSRGRNDNNFIEERTRSGNRNAPDGEVINNGRNKKGKE
ncbi:uncharacterized protein TNCV_3082591 [Trichonephila clavipes]|nr:uncharacterized protein TNCV_3082591 [Trichonephila clavipes]